MKVVKLLDQASKDGPRGSLREQVGEHHDAGEVFDGDNATADEIAKKLGGAQDVLGFLRATDFGGQCRSVRKHRTKEIARHSAPSRLD